MTEMQKYLAEEVAEDLADGIITRREAMRRLGLLGVSGAASALLAAGAVAPAVAGGKRHRRRSTETTWDPADHESITFPGPRGTPMASWAPAAKARGGVLVIHENRGLTAHISRVASRFAASGWSALALDLLSEEGSRHRRALQPARDGRGLAADAQLVRRRWRSRPPLSKLRQGEPMSASA